MGPRSGLVGVHVEDGGVPFELNLWLVSGLIGVHRPGELLQGTLFRKQPGVVRRFLAGLQNLLDEDRQLAVSRLGFHPPEELLDLALKIAGAGKLIPVVGTLGQSLEQDGSQRRRDVGVLVQTRADIAVAYGFQNRDLALAIEQALAGEHFEQQGAGREDVGAGVDSLAPGLLGRHVWELAFERALLRGGHFGRGLGHPEVAELYVTLAADEDVAW